MQAVAKLRVMDFRQIAVVACGYGAGCLMAFAVLGLTGVASAMFFAPVVLWQLRRPKGAGVRAVKPDQEQARPFIVSCLSRFLGQIGHPTVALVVEVDGHDHLEEVYGRTAMDDVAVFVRDAIEAHLTEHDVTVHLEGSRFVAALAPTAPHSLETMLNTCTRIQHAMADAVLVTELPTAITVSIGFAASSKLERPTGDALIQAAFTALSEARRRAPNAVRGYSTAMATKRIADRKIVRDARRAFERGEIFAYFQPQIDLSDGSLSGFEALTRWHHPERGILSPADFLPALEQAGLMPSLGHTMIKQAIQAMTFWDKSGLDVRRVGVNFSTAELRHPRLVDDIATQLELNGIAPHRLVIEVLETVVASAPNDVIVGNLAALADLGCGVDLDDFGTGYASIANIRRFSVGRIKIDRSFISGLDNDVEQRNMVSAILTMAHRLGVSTLAEGVETTGELDVLMALGCGDVQGFQVARPMPVQETVEWAGAYFARRDEPFQISRRAG